MPATISHLELSMELFRNLDAIYTFLLLVVRYTGMFLFLPGLGQGMQGLIVRMPAVLVLSFASMFAGPLAPPPTNWVVMFAAVVAELLLGSILGYIPAMIISGLHAAGQMAATTMGLGAAQLIDPGLGITVPSLGRIFGDMAICVFLLMGGHHLLIYAAAGLGGEIVPGSYLVGESSIAMLIERTGNIFLMGVMISAPVVVALLLTQFVMGLISKAVPQVNIFIVSFPLTIGIGLVLSMLSLPEIVVYVQRELGTIEKSVAQVSVDSTHIEASQSSDF